tara:strand:+ start:441 stop:1340 length:900 start_codon:yes stop_codon:yes gene_type:complete
MTFSIVIPTKNRTEQLKTLFRSIISQKRLPDQIIIIDQSEKDKVEKSNFLESTIKTKLRLNYIHDVKIEGLVEAKHSAIPINDCDYITFLDDDIVLEPNYLYEIEKALHRFPNMIGVNGLIQNHPKVTFLKRLLFKITHFGNFKDDRISVIKSIQIDSNTPKKVNVLSGGLSTWRKDIFNTTSFDTKNKFHAYEDKDFSMRVKKKFTESFYIIPRAKLSHYHSKLNRQNLLDRSKNDVIEIIMLFKKNGNYNFLGFDLFMLLSGLLINSIILSFNYNNVNFIKNFFRGSIQGFKKKINK